MAHTPTLTRIGDRGQRFQQADRVRIQVIGGPAGVVEGSKDRRG
jgi:hypothetical protein